MPACGSRLNSSCVFATCHGVCVCVCIPCGSSGQQMWFVWRWLWLLFLAVSSAPGCNRTAPPCWRTPSLSRSCPGSRTLHRTHLQRGVTQMCLHECWCMLPLLCNNGSRYSACVEKRETWIIERLEVCNVWINVQVVSQWGFSPASRCSWEIYQYYKISDIVTSWYGQSVVLSLFQRVQDRKSVV